ncbi:SPFH domain-containing protein [Ectobacillus antri]|jgi:regulator of protease activity HflC (stomatin/prohibitin superfamily)|uniref:SPFH domain-containing protein n=1 Tax=Ectobacillus antri TaxID=2486280 RepID=A0ABT6H4M3_9BACI|nr:MULTISPECIES: SPFH domain-containing protein [Ectobacillus]MDG4658404.1 SPFH domain-containing protein [Ectobacillus antri]MDG5753738.1 SPFH domain-containing protein [Ectobacillus antri]UOY92658.1 SPFH domain-containing protein [Ectobacillus sp. JY-23]
MKEQTVWKINGFIGLLLLVVIVVFALYYSVVQYNPLYAIGAGILALLVASGMTIVQPNESVAVIFFGKYLGTIREEGFFITIPSIRKKVSLRVRNFNSDMLKVNDVDGNPIEIAAVVVFKVTDTAKALFDVENYHEFVRIQSETALRHVATKYPYDTSDDKAWSLRGNAEEIANEIAQELQERLSVSGVQVLEARLTHLAYAPEIAGAMLQRQQANAVLAARQKIVEGAVGMVEAALRQLEDKQVVQLDDEMKAQMVSNLMIAIVSEKGTQPVMNAGKVK